MRDIAKLQKKMPKICKNFRKITTHTDVPTFNPIPLPRHHKPQ